MGRREAAFAFLVCMALLALPGGVRADGEEEPAPRYTDEDLKPKRSAPQSQPSSPAQTAPAAARPPQTAPGAAPDSRWADGWRHDQERRRFWEGRIQAAEGEVQRILQRIEYLERKRASVQNPFLPRVDLPEEDRRAEEGMDNAARLARVEEQIAQARADLDKARQAVEKARADAAEALAPPSPLGQPNPSN